MPLFALTIFLGAFLLFQVQPLIGKFILPWFGGSPGVWTTCLLFFQTLLLGGYAYAHWVSSLTPRRQSAVHLALLIVSLAWLPIVPGTQWQPHAGEEPVTRILLLLLATLGLPYLVLSATGPLLQRWFNLSQPGVSPYRLYALSNVGSLLALLSYPFVFEPLLSRRTQAVAWSLAFVAFVALCALCAWRIRRVAAPVAAAPERDPEITATPAAADRFLWIALPAIASLLLVATTDKLTLDVAAVPFLWILPLTLYLLSFILCFDHPRWYSRRFFAALLAVGSATVCYLLSSHRVPLEVQVVGYSVTLFAACMVCHGEVYRLRPPPRHLTSFYLSLSAGGALGGMFVALIAPVLFDHYRELQVGLVALAYLIGVISLLYRSRSLALGLAAGTLAIPLVIPALRALTHLGVLGWLVSYLNEMQAFYQEHWREVLAVAAALVSLLAAGWRIGAGPWHRRMAAVPFVLMVLLGMIFIMQASRDARSLETAVRNFYGVLKLRAYGDAEEPAFHYRVLAHGETTHGMQFIGAPRDREATSYYGSTSGVGRLLDLVPGQRRVGLVGLGAGTLAIYARPGDSFRFYEINPVIVELAYDSFTYLGESAANLEIAIGDARLVLDEERRQEVSQGFDVLVLDAFSSDAIPVHLLTAEAMDLYLHHLRPDGVIAFHISNRHLDLRPVVETLARDRNLSVALIEDYPADESWWIYRTSWMLVSRNQELLNSPAISPFVSSLSPVPRVVRWTDDHASLFDVLY